jgi:hypothetical protein
MLFLSFVIVVLAAGARGLDVDISTISIATEGEFFVQAFHAKNEVAPKLIVVTYNDDDAVSDFPRRVHLYDVSASGVIAGVPSLDMELPAAMHLVDTTTSGSVPMFVGYQDQRLYALDVTNGQFTDMIAVPSIFRGINRSNSPKIEIFKDLNDDDRDDVIMADFAGWQVAIQFADGSYSQPLAIGPPPFMAIGTDRYTAFRAEEPYFLDSNVDGKQDIAFWIDGELSVHLQRDDGTFEPDPVRLDTGHSDVLEGFYSLSIGADPDNPDGAQRVLESIDDIDNDGLADLIVQTISGDGIFGKETRYEFFLGHAGEMGSLAFPQSPTTIIESNGIQAMYGERVDLNGDGLQEVIVTSIDIGIGTIVRALLTRTFSLDVGIYSLSEGGFPRKPNIERSVTARLDLGRGELFLPHILPADVTGDGILDWLVQESETELRVYEGTGGPGLFSKKYSSHDIGLPRNPRGFQVVDLNGDGRDELLLKHGEDEQKLISLVTFR